MYSQTKQLIREVLSNPKLSILNLFRIARHLPSEDAPSMIRNLVLSLPNEIKERYAEECAFVEAMPLDDLTGIMFPYPERMAGPGVLETSTGVEKGLPYVMHNLRSKLFFLKNTNKADMLGKYQELVDREGLLGTGKLAKSPHCYQDGEFRVENGDVLLDVGCAEAVFSLDNIDIASKVYLFESSPEWCKPLQLTFAPYGEKVVLVNKLVSDRTDNDNTTLLDVVKADVKDGVHFFVKMDIEGWERIVISGNEDFFTSAKIKLSCCVYHRQDDAQIIESMLKQKGYKTRFSDGWMLPAMNGIHYPYFRHGVIYAQNY